MLREWLAEGHAGIQGAFFWTETDVGGSAKRLPADPATWCWQYQVLQNANVPLVGHFGRDIVARTRIKDSCPDLILIVAHLGWHFEYGLRPQLDYVRNVLKTLAAIPKVFFDLSALDHRENDL